MNKIKYNNKKYPDIKESQPTILTHTVFKNLGKDKSDTKMNEKRQIRP